MGTPCTTNQTSFTDPSLLPGDIVKDYHINELKDAINREYLRRTQTNPDEGIDKLPGDIISRTEFMSVINKIDTLLSYSWVSGVKTDALIEAEHIREMQRNVNLEEVKCLCDCNYCTCQCNYCTCDCNYCTCDCNYACTCDCDYACTCDCNYVACTCDCDYAACTCDCNYACTCDCNYACTCDCNYVCSCDCNYCTCDCNYACTCDCNYSDIRLKTEIKYF